MDITRKVFLTVLQPGCRDEIWSSGGGRAKDTVHMAGRSERWGAASCLGAGCPEGLGSPAVSWGGYLGRDPHHSDVATAWG